MPPRLPPLADPPADVAEILDRTRIGPGPPLNIFATLAHHPRLLNRFNVLGGLFLGRGLLPARERELVILRTGWRAGSEYEFGQHTLLGRGAGLTEQEIERTTREAADWPEGDALLVRLADEVHGTRDVSEELWNALAQRWSAAEMIELARRLRPHGVTVELIGPADARARARIEPAQAAGLLRWHGFVPNDRAMPMLDGALAGLSLLHDEPNFRHSMPTKVVEYMARGVPVVTTPLPAAAELARGHECGFVVPFGDVAAAAGAVLELDRDLPLRMKMGRRGHEAAYSSLGWPSDAREFVAQLESWAKSGSGSR